MAARRLSLLLCCLAFVLLARAAAAQPAIWTSGTFTYDGSGNITATGADAYTYDALGRLKTANADRERTGANNQQTYTYDSFGNRLRTTTSGVTCVGGCAPDVTVDGYNHLSDHGATYDEAGNLKTFSPFRYEYDGSGMLIGQSSPGGIDWQYIYTADDERVATYTGGGNWRFTLRDLDGKVLREVTALQSSGGTTWTRDRDHVYRDGLLLATVEAGGATEQFHLDHLGTPRVVTNATGSTIGIHTYYPFGDELALNLNESPLEKLKFTGHERDVNSINGNSLDYMHARYYSSNMGRFLSVDGHPGEAGRPQSWNRYAYASNNPINRIDPDGYADFYVTTTFSHGDFHDDRVSDYLSYNATNFDISNGTATPKNFQKGLNDPEGVSIYFGHSNTTDSLLFNKAGFVPFSDFSNHNAVTCIAACNSTAILKDAKVGPGQALIGVTSNMKAGFVKAGDLSYISTQLITGLKAGKTVGQIVDGLNKYYADRAKKDPNYKVQLTIKGDRTIVVK